jgi:poly(A) polymerase
MDARADAMEVVRRLREAGHVAYFAGGCVRDELLGIEPKDYDVATDAVPEAVRALFGRRWTQAVGAAFGVILVRQGRSQLEVATFRTDGSYSDGRRPDSVRFTNAEQDARRRDFTINGLFRDPFATLADPDDDGIIDHVDGRRDLADKVLRCIGRPIDRFGEDYLRMLRAVRFAARFRLSVERDTMSAIRELAPRLAAVTPERVGDEVRRKLTAPTRGEAWRLLWETGLIGVVFRTLPDPNPDVSVRRPVLDHLARIDRPISIGLALAGTAVELRRQAGLPLREIFETRHLSAIVQASRQALRLSNDETAGVAGALAVGALIFEPPARLAGLKRFLATPHAADALELARALAFDVSLQARVAELEAAVSDARSQGQIAPPPLVTGEDLIAAGLTPGPGFKAALDAAYDAQLEGRVGTKDRALELALRVAGIG